jgi:hypothetical protein
MEDQDVQARGESGGEWRPDTDEADKFKQAEEAWPHFRKFHMLFGNCTRFNTTLYKESHQDSDEDEDTAAPIAAAQAAAAPGAVAPAGSGAPLLPACSTRMEYVQVLHSCRMSSVDNCAAEPGA